MNEKDFQYVDEIPIGNTHYKLDTRCRRCGHKLEYGQWINASGSWEMGRKPSLSWEHNECPPIKIDFFEFNINYGDPEIIGSNRRTEVVSFKAIYNNGRIVEGKNLLGHVDIREMENTELYEDKSVL